MTSMYNSIQHFNEFGVKTIEKTVRKFIKEGKDLVDCQRRTIFDPSEEFYFVKNSLANKQNSGLHYTVGCQIKKCQSPHRSSDYRSPFLIKQAVII